MILLYNKKKLREKYDRKQKKKQKKEAEQLTKEFLAQTEEKNEEVVVLRHTVSIALPGSILDNAQSPELRTYLAGQIARALVIFNIDEVIIFNENPQKKGNNDGLFKGATKATDPNVVFARILQYLECPQYLRKYFFPFHQDLKYAGLLNPLDCPHHMRMDDHMPYREGVTLNRPVKGGGSYVNAGMRKELKVDKLLKPDVRVTVRLDPYEDEDVEKKKYLTGSVVSPTTPREKDGLYWGYTVRLANSFNAVFTETPYKDGYDLTMGTSERGETVDNMELPNFNHMLLVFGGLKGLESSLESDESLQETDVELLFDRYINSCPNQGSRTIRTEEAILITLSALRPKIEKIT